MKEGTSKASGDVSEFLYICERKQLAFRSEIKRGGSKEDRKQKGLRQPRRATRVICIRSANVIFNSVESQWLIK